MLNTQVKELEEAYSKLHYLAGELLATLAMPANQQHIRQGNGLDMLFEMIEKKQKAYWDMPKPEEPQKGAGKNEAQQYRGF